MSIPPPIQPHQPPGSSSNNKRTGALAATLVVILISAIVGLLYGGITGLVVAALMSFGCVIAGAILTTSKRSSQFAMGFMIAGAILVVASTVLGAGVCFNGVSNA